VGPKSLGKTGPPGPSDVSVWPVRRPTSSMPAASKNGFQRTGVLTLPEYFVIPLGVGLFEVVEELLPGRTPGFPIGIRLAGLGVIHEEADDFVEFRRPDDRAGLALH